MILVFCFWRLQRQPEAVRVEYVWEYVYVYMWVCVCMCMCMRKCVAQTQSQSTIQEGLAYRHKTSPFADISSPDIMRSLLTSISPNAPAAATAATCSTHTGGERTAFIPGKF